MNWNSLTEQQKKWWTILICTLAVLMGIGLSIVTRTTVEKVKPVIVAPAVTLRPADLAKQSVLKNLDWADVNASAELEPQLAAVKDFFQAARGRTRKYGEVVLSWNSKWKLASSYVSGGKEHSEFLQAQFDQLLFTKAELDQLVQQVVAAYLRHTQDVENQMMVKLKADLDQLPTDSLPRFVDQAELHTTLAKALDQASAAAKAELGVTVGREFVAFLASEVLTMAAAQLATSSGILAAGGASSWATLGVGILVSIIVDAIVTKVYHQQFDPIGKLAGLLNDKLTTMESLILKGTRDSPGLEVRLKDYTARRNAARRQAVQNAVLAP